LGAVLVRTGFSFESAFFRFVVLLAMTFGLYFLKGLTLAITLFLGYAGACGLRLHTAEKHRTCSTRFPRAESPIFEGGIWINGETAGVDWADVPGRRRASPLEQSPAR
jgi:hypothetical protein